MAPMLADNIDEIITDPATYADEALYHRTFAALRSADPVHWCAPAQYHPFWAVTRHADIMRVELDAANFRNEPRQFLVTIDDQKMMEEQTGESNFARNLVAMDNPDHKAHRALTADWFGAKSVRAPIS